MEFRSVGFFASWLPFNVKRGRVCAMFLLQMLCIATGSAGEFLIGYGTNGLQQVAVPVLSGIPRDVAAGFNHSLVVDDDDVLAWGDGSFGQTNVPNGLASISSVAAGFRHSLALLGDGSVVAWGDDAFGQSAVPPGLTGIVAVAAGGFHTLALDKGGSPRVWGQSLYGQTIVPQSAMGLKAIAAGAYHNVGIRSNGTLVAWGYNGAGQATAPFGLFDVQSVASGFYHNVALRSNGLVHAWGWNASGQTNVPATLSNVISVAAGLNHSLALRADGRVVSWGSGSAGQLVDPDDAANVTAVAAGADFTILRTRGPVVMEHPVGAVLSGTAELILSAGGMADAPLSFQWEKDGVVIANATNSVLPVTNTQAVAAGHYRCVISNSNGVVRTRSALLATPPVFTIQPLPTEVYYGSNASLTVTVEGFPTPQLQWRRNGVPLAGATNSTLNLSNIASAADGNYSVVASNAAGSVTSDVVHLWVRSQPTLTVAAYSEGTFGGFASMETRAAGSSPDSIQWQFNNQNIAPSPNGHLQLNPLRPAHAGVYRFIGYTPAGPVASSEVTITVSPANPVQFAGRKMILEAGDGNGTITEWQWRRGGVDVPGGTNANLVLEPLTASDAGDYTVVVTDAFSQRELSAARLTVLPEPPPGVAVSWGAGAPSMPTNSDFVAIEAGSSHGLLLRADGSVTGFGNDGCSAITIPASLTNAVAISAGIYNSMALRSDGRAISFGNCSCVPCASVIDRAVAISMGAWHGVALLNDGTVGVSGETQYAPPAGLSNIVAVAAGYEHSLTLSSNGTVMNWGNNGGGMQTVPVGLNSVQAIAAGSYHNLALRSNGTVVAWGLNASGQCNVPPGLNNVVAVRAGGNNSMAIRADRTVVVWGSNDAGLNSLPPGTTNVLDAGSGDYYGVALLGGFDRPAILHHPQSSTNDIGTSVIFSVFARSTTPLTYQWRHGAEDLIGATNSTLLVADVTPADGGFYSVVVSTPAGTVTSSPAYLYVIPAPFLAFPSGTPGKVVAWGRNIYGETNVPAGLSNAVALSAGSGSLDTFAYRADGRITRWGGGVGLPLSLTNLVSVFGAPNYGFGLNANGTVEAWGLPDYTGIKPGITGVKAIGAGAVKLVLHTNGVVQAADNTTLLNGVTNAASIAVGGGHALALLNDGTILLDKWNYPNSEQTAPPANWSNVVAVAAGQHHSLVLLSDGTVAAWGRNAESQCSVPPGLSNVVAIAAAGNHSLALKADRTVVAWGDSSSGLNQIPAGLTNVVAITCGYFHNAVIQAGPVFTLHPTNLIAELGANVSLHAAATAVQPVQYQWYRNGILIPGATNSLITLTNAQAQEAGTYLVRAEADGFAVTATAQLSLGPAITVYQRPASLWVLADDTAIFSVGATNAAPLSYQWFAGTELLAGATNSMLLLTNVQVQQAGSYRVSIHNDLGMVTNLSAQLSVVSPQAMGKVVSFGSNTNVPTWLSGVIAIAAGDEHSLALRADGTVVSWGSNSHGQTNVPAGLSNVIAIAGGGRHSLALKRDGSMAGWGHNFNGQASPPGVTGARAVAGGNSFSAAIDQAGGVLAWGNAFNGALNVPVITNGVRVAAGSDHGLVLRSDGTVVGWGGNAYGQASQATNFTDVAQIAAGHVHSMVLRSNGTVAAFGMGSMGQTNVPANLSNVVDIAANYGRSLAVRSNGTITGWGLNDRGQTQPPAGLSNVVKVAAGTYHTLALRETGCFIWGPPTNTTILAGSNATFRVGVVGVGPLSYQWRFKGQDIPAATNAILQLDGVQFTNSGSYSVVVTSARGFEESVAATLTVLSPPIFTAHPASQSVALGSNVSFSIVVTGTAPVSLQWQRNGTNLFNATGAILNLTSVTLASSGGYRVVATNLYGRATSEVAQLTLNVPPTILLPPNSQIAVTGSNVSFAVSAGGSQPLAYQWFKSGGAISDATNSVLSLMAVQDIDAAEYLVCVTNNFGAVTSSPALLTVTPIQPTILAGPNPVTAPFGGSAAFSVVAGGASPLQYQWLLNGANIPGANASSLNISNLSLADGGEYRVRVINDVGSTLSDPALLTLRLPPNVVAWGSNQLGQINVPDDLTNAIAIAAGDNHNLAVREDGTVVAWGDNSNGQCNPPAGLTNVVAVAAGSRQSLALLSSGMIVGWGATNSYGEATPPANATNVIGIEGGVLHSLAVLSNGTVVGWGYNAYGQATPPAGLTNVVAVTAGFEHSVALHHDGTITGWGNYYGEPNGLSNVVAIASASTEFLALQSDGRVVTWGYGNFGQLKYDGPTNAIAVSGGGSSVSITSGGKTTVYRPHFLAILTNGLPYVWGTNPANIYTPPSTLANVAAIASGFDHNLALVRAPLIIRQPVAQTVNEGDPVLMLVETARSDDAHYQWHWNDQALLGATNSNFALAQAHFPDSGLYTVSVSNRFGVVISRAAQLVVLPKVPVITVQPAATAVLPGNQARFSVTAIGFGQLSYQWLLNNAPIPGATSSNLTILDVSALHCGLYAVVVANEHGFSLSSDAALTFAAGELILDNPQAMISGPWTESLATGRYGTNSLFKSQGFGDAAVQFAGALPRSGNYQVYQWHAAVPNRASAVPFRIAHAGGDSWVAVNQTLGAGMWHSIGVFPFASNAPASVIISDGLPTPGLSAVADAVRFVYVLSPPAILLPPQDRVAAPGASVDFTVHATGAAPLRYQWRKNGVNLPFATNDWLTLTEVEHWDGGSYSVLISGPDGTALSSPATLTVTTPPLQVQVMNQSLVLEWTGNGVLQSSTNVQGPYLDIPTAVSPYTNWLGEDAQRFFRIRNSSISPSLNLESAGHLSWPHHATLQTATQVNGPFVDVPWAQSPFTNRFPATPTRFFRLRY